MFLHDSNFLQILAHNGILFGGRYDRQLGLDEPLKINVFDTPGFADSDADLVSKKNQRKLPEIF